MTRHNRRPHPPRTEPRADVCGPEPSVRGSPNGAAAGGGLLFFFAFSRRPPCQWVAEGRSRDVLRRDDFLVVASGRTTLAASLITPTIAPVASLITRAAILPAFFPRLAAPFPASEI